MNTEIVSIDDLINVLKDAIPCKSCGEKPRVGFLGGLASSIGCRNERNLRRYLVNNRCIYSDKITDYDRLISLRDIVKIWNRHNSIQEEK